MAFVTKTWKDRLVEFAGRRKLKNVSTGEEILMDVSRSEGTVMQPGDAFSAENMNNLEQRIKTEFDNVNSSLGGLSFAQDAKGKWGYKVGADAVIPFKSGANIIKTLVHGQNQAQTYTFTDNCDSALVLTANVDDAGNHAPSVKVSSGTVSRNVFSYCQNSSRYLNYAIYKLSNIPKGGTITITVGGYLGISYIVG